MLAEVAESEGSRRLSIAMYSGLGGQGRRHNGGGAERTSQPSGGESGGFGGRGGGAARTLYERAGVALRRPNGDWVAMCLWAGGARRRAEIQSRCYGREGAIQREAPRKGGRRTRTSEGKS